MQSLTEKSEVKNMESQMIHQISSEHQVSSHANWHTLYRQLTVIVTRWVCSANLPTWKAQCEDIIDEIVQETMMKVLKRIRRGESGELSPVYSVGGLCVRVAHNVFIDMVRHDRRLVPLASDSWHHAPYDFPDDGEDYSEVAVDNVYTASLFRQVALAIQAFPPKLRAALIIDLVSRMSFDGEATPLQQALLNAGIDLEQYRGRSSSDPIARSRQASLVSLGYKKIGTLDSIQEYA
jgi:DNA-directed RNA polymerase specialized sigma24 family protein